MENRQPDLWFSDKPLSDPKEDRLGYSSFAQRIAENILKMAPPEGLVIAIHGPWGSGKSSVLEFVCHYLQEKPPDEQPLIVRFNPWWFSGQEDFLVWHFFDQLAIALGSSKWRERTEKVIDLVKRLSEIVSAVPVPGAELPLKLAKQFPELNSSDINKIKETIEKELRKADQRILVIIDDIDRLTSEEIRLLFRTIKAVADFPNTTYLLAFDKEVVIQALQEIQGTSGEAYLEKILQVPFELPIPDPFSLRMIVTEALELILGGLSDEVSEQSRWVRIYREIEHFIKTPRHAKRLINTLNATYPAVKGEVNPIDFTAIEAIRIFQPSVYEAIRTNEEAFVGSMSLYVLDSQMEEFKKFHEGRRARTPEEFRAPLENILKLLFPKLENLDRLGGRVIHSDLSTEWRKSLRICSPDMFDIYFHLGVPEGNISNFEMGQILALADDAGAFGQKLIELATQKRPDGISRLRLFLHRLQDYIEDDIPLDHIPSIIQAIYTVGDKLPVPEDQASFWDFWDNARIVLGWIVEALLQRIESNRRLDILSEAIQEGEGLSLIVRQTIQLGLQHRKYDSDRVEPEEERIVSAEELEIIENLVLDKLRSRAQDDSLLHAIDLPGALYFWSLAGDQNEVREWVSKVISSDKGLIEFLTHFLQETRSYSDIVPEIGHRIDPRLDSYLDPPEIIERVRNLAENEWLSEKQAKALGQFIEEYELRQQGGDSDDPLQD